MVRTASAPLKEADAIVLAKARAYVARKYYLQVQVFTMWWTEVDILQDKYQGKWYKHNAGYVWVLSRRTDILKMLLDIESRLPSATGFENVIIKTLDLRATQIKNVTE